MNREKPYLPVLVIHTDEPLRELDALGQNWAIALEIDPYNPKMNKAWPDFLIKSDIPFLILVDGRKSLPFKDIAPEMTDLMVMCLFSRSYIRQEDNPVVAFLHREDRSSDNAGEYILPLIAHLQLQGWSVILRWDLPLTLSFCEQVLGKLEGPLLVQDQEPDEEFLLTHFLSNPSYAGQYIFFSSSDRAELLEKDFSTLCQNAMRDQPLFSKYLLCYIGAKKNAAESYRQRKVLQERLENAEMTIGIIRSKYKDDYELLFNWYQKEYEVLPLWYKRFGHIIKVLTGRRTFKSLFVDEKKRR
jgi:hypothetical protein